MALKAIRTRFRAYQLSTAGSSFSYFSDNTFTLIEGRYCDVNEDSIKYEMAMCEVDRIHNLHITSWDQDHCSPKQLEKILEELKPYKIEYPGYTPHTDSGKESLRVIRAYKPEIQTAPKLVSVTPKYIKSLENASSYGYRDILYWPKNISTDNANDNSTIKQFRTGSFNVLSLGDVESNNISAYIRNARTVNSEVDVMIMAHHGANNGFTTSAFLKSVRPTLAIATSNYGNQFDHPKPEIRKLLDKHQVKIFTTKTGDVIVKSVGSHTGKYQVVNLKSGSTDISSQYEGSAKKASYLKNNQDTLRDRRTKHYRGPRL